MRGVRAHEDGAAMRIEMPLYEFACADKGRFPFGTSGLAIDRFTVDSAWKLDDLSEVDAHYVRSASWALIYEGDDPGYAQLVSLLIISFRTFLDYRPPFIKYRLHRDDERVTRIQPMTYNYSAPRRRHRYDPTDLMVIAVGFQHLRQMDEISIRTKNGLYFLYRSFHAEKWIDSFILMMCAIESLFSKDSPGGATEAITTRVSSILCSQARCTKADIELLYDIRSQMTHGRLEASDDPGTNLRHLEHLEFVAVRCFRELARNKAYMHYATKKARDNFMGTLNA